MPDQKPLKSPNPDCIPQTIDADDDDHLKVSSIPRDHQTLQGNDQDKRMSCLNSICTARLIDPETQAEIRIREDMVMEILYPMGERLVLHPDETRVTSTFGEWKVESNYYPTVVGTSSSVTVRPCPGKPCYLIHFHFVDN